MIIVEGVKLGASQAAGARGTLIGPASAMEVKTLPRAPDCLQCTHFRVSWDPDFPRACTVFGIKSRKLPSHVVFEATGRHCPVFERSPRIKS
jgi:hypothetical protein